MTSDMAKTNTNVSGKVINVQGRKHCSGFCVAEVLSLWEEAEGVTCRVVESATETGGNVWSLFIPLGPMGNTIDLCRQLGYCSTS